MASGTGLELMIDALAAYRITRLVTQDAITEPARRAIDLAAREVDWAPGRWLAEMVHCPWCVGAWVAGAVTAAAAGAPRAWRPVARALATAAAVGLIAERA